MSDVEHGEDGRGGERPCERPASGSAPGDIAERRDRERLRVLLEAVRAELAAVGERPARGW